MTLLQDGTTAWNIWSTWIVIMQATTKYRLLFLQDEYGHTQRETTLMWNGSWPNRFWCTRSSSWSMWYVWNRQPFVSHVLMGVYFGFIGDQFIIGIHTNTHIYLVASGAESSNWWCCFWDQNERHWREGRTTSFIFMVGNDTLEWGIPSAHSIEYQAKYILLWWVVLFSVTQVLSYIIM